MLAFSNLKVFAKGWKGEDLNQSSNDRLKDDVKLRQIEILIFFLEQLLYQVSLEQSTAEVKTEYTKYDVNSFSKTAKITQEFKCLLSCNDINSFVIVKSNY